MQKSYSVEWGEDWLISIKRRALGALRACSTAGQPLYGAKAVPGPAPGNRPGWEVLGREPAQGSGKEGQGLR